MESKALHDARKRVLLGLLETDPGLIKWLKGILKVYEA